MMNIIKDLRTLITQELLALYPSLHQSSLLERVTVDNPKDPSHGDLATNAAIALSKTLNIPPMDLGNQLAQKLQHHTHIISVVVAKPGFINITFSEVFWHEQMKQILANPSQFGKSSIGQGKKVNVEFVSANPTGPLHAGHARNAVLGDAISALFDQVGYNVTKEYYINDAGGQTIALAKSVYLRYQEALGKTIPKNAFEGDLYPGAYLIPVAQALVDQDGDKWLSQDETVWLEPIRLFAIDRMMDMIKDDLKQLGLHMDTYTSEYKLAQDGHIQEMVDQLTQSEDIYKGTLPPPKGQPVDDWEPREQLLFKATNYGDDSDRPLQKSDGSWTYFAGDIAYHYNKFTRGYDRIVDVLGADHAGYVKRIKAAALAVSGGKKEIDIVVSQLVRLMEKGEIVRMSKRDGNFITLREIIDRVGKDVVRFIMLTRRHDVGIDFDFAKVIEQTKDNPVFYVQYAHARCHSILRHAKNIFGEHTDEDLISCLHLLTDPHELAIIKKISLWPHCVEQAALHCEPHRVVYFMSELASLFHALWTMGKDQKHLKFIDPDNKILTFGKLALIKTIATTITSGLRLFRIEPVEEMR